MRSSPAIILILGKIFSKHAEVDDYQIKNQTWRPEIVVIMASYS